MVPCTILCQFYSIESGANVFDSLGWDMEIAVFGDCIGRCLVAVLMSGIVVA